MSELTVGGAVQYYSTSHECWISTTVEDIRPTGEVQIACKPGVWITVEEQPEKLRVLARKSSQGVCRREGYTPSSSPLHGAALQAWSAERSIALGARNVVGMGARSADELSWARVLDSVTSVHTAVEQLNSGVLHCPDRFCVVFSASSKGHYLLFRNADAGWSSPKSVLQTPRSSVSADKTLEQQLAEAQQIFFEEAARPSGSRSSVGSSGSKSSIADANLQKDLREKLAAAEKRSESEAHMARKSSRRVSNLETILADERKRKAEAQSAADEERERRTEVERSQKVLEALRQSLERELEEQKKMLEGERQRLMSNDMDAQSPDDWQGKFEALQQEFIRKDAALAAERKCKEDLEARLGLAEAELASKEAELLAAVHAKQDFQSESRALAVELARRESHVFAEASAGQVGKANVPPSFDELQEQAGVRTSTETSPVQSGEYKGPPKAEELQVNDETHACEAAMPGEASECNMPPSDELLPVKLEDRASADPLRGETNGCSVPASPETLELKPDTRRRTGETSDCNDAESSPGEVERMPSRSSVGSLSEEQSSKDGAEDNVLQSREEPQVESARDIDVQEGLLANGTPCEALAALEVTFGNTVAPEAEETEAAATGPAA